MRILTIRESIWLNTTPGKAWRRILSIEEWAGWNPEIIAARWVGHRGWKEGHRFRLVCSTPRRPFLRGGTITSVDAGREICWVARFFPLRVEFCLRISPEGVGTRVEFMSTFRGIAVRLVGQDTVVRALSQFQRQFLAELRESGERVSAR